MRNTPQTCLDSADNDRNISVSLAGTLGIDDDRSIRPLTALTSGGLGVVASNPAIARIPIDHRIHISGGDAEKEVGLAEDPKWIGALPVRLGDDSDPETLRLEQAPDDSHPETRVVDVCVARDHDDVATVPAQSVHLRTTHGQEGRHPKSGGPVLAVGKDVGSSLHGVCIRPKC